MSAHVAVVLAAGGSRRLGRPKQLLQRDGQALVQRALGLAQSTQPRRTLLVLGAQAEAIAGCLDLQGIERVDNPHWASGLSSSVRIAREVLASGALDREVESVLFLVCDQPALETTHLQALLTAARATVRGCAATVHGVRLGVPAVIPWRELAEVPLQGDAGLRGLLNGEDAATIARVPAPALALDLDTPEDVAEAIARGWLDPDQAAG